MKHKYMVFVLCMISAAFIVACDIPSPITEMAEAKAAITKASKYSAEKYAKKEFDESVKLLMDTHTLLKEDKAKEASDSAVKARAKAEEAYTKSLPPYAQDAIDKAKTDLADAKGFNADEFAPDETKRAEAEIAEAENIYKKADYIPAYDMARQASASAQSAKDKVLSNLPVLRGKLASLEADYDELKSMNAEQFAKEDMTALATDISALQTLIESNKIKDANIKVQSATEKVDKIREAGLAIAVRQKISKAEDLIASASVSPDVAQVAPELETAKQKVKAANEHHSLKNYQKASESADEALAMLDAITLALEKIAGSRGLTGGSVSDGKDASLAGQVVEYIVKWHKINTDCLWRIAEKVYKNARMWPLIYSANRDQIKDPDLIYPGQKLIIPPIPVREKAAEKDTEKPIEPAAKESAAPSPSPSPAAKNNEASASAAPSSEKTAAPAPSAAEIPKANDASGNSSPAPSPSPSAPAASPASESAAPK
jgi:nucleoid-associated protein YgaU